MGRRGIIWPAIAIVAGVCLALFYLEEKPAEPVAEPPLLEEPPLPATESKPHTQTTTRSISQPELLRDYGSPGTSVEEDLELVNDVLQRFWLLIKDPDQLRVGSNEEIVEVLSGSNPGSFEFISPDNRFVDEQGRLLDRWRTPLFFHADSLTDIEIRSAGPDKSLFTEDDRVTRARSSQPLR